MAAYIEYNESTNMPINEDAALAYYGFYNNNTRIIPFTQKDMFAGKYFDNILQRNIFVGGPETMMYIFNRLGKMPKSITFPNTREFNFGTLKEVKDKFLETKEPIFVKPVRNKAFNGQAIRDLIDLSSLKNVPDDTEVGYSQVYDGLKAEFRVYVYNNEIQLCCNYAGDGKLQLSANDIESIEKQIRYNKEEKFPVAYTMDVGIGDNLMLLIEYNDFWAIGNYGLDTDIYINMLRARYNEIVN